ncbi:MAG TPA: amino acid permease [Ktedonobacterales bacterium]|nr:amino acid permease [Ktedonobacterales bacterium]
MASMPGESSTSSVTTTTTEQGHRDAQQLERLGYNQELRRTMSTFSNFAATFSYISVTTGIFALFAFGLGTGGPAFFWSWPIVFGGQLLVGLVFAELVSHYPLAGSVFQWTKQVANADVAWLNGWIYLVAQVATIAAVDFTVPPVIASLLGLNASDTHVLIAIALVVLLLTTVINIVGVRMLAIINNIGVLAELGGMLVLGLILLFHAHHSVTFLFNDGGTSVNGSYLGTFMAAMLMSLFVVYGFDTAGTLAEETHNPSRAAPRALLLALLGSFVLGGLFLVGAILAVSSEPGALAKIMADPNALETIIEQSAPGLSNVFFVIVSTAISVCGLSVQANAARLLYSMGRDRQVPFGRFVGRVSPRFGTPVTAILVTAVLGAVLIFATQVEAVLVAVTVVLIYLAYGICTAATLVARFRGWPHERSAFSLGGAGLIINLIAVIYGVVMIINLSWYRPAPGAAAYLNYATYIFVPVIIVIGLLYYYGFQKRRALS